MNPVVHFEMPYEDKNRMAKFYQDAFGWKTHIMGDDLGGYVMAQTTETDDKGMIQKPGHINGGFFQKNTDHPHPSVVIAVDDIHAAMKKAAAAGATNFKASKPNEPDMIPNVGWYINFTDTEGNLASLLQPTRM